MKNIHVLPTDKPSRLVRNNKNLLKLCIQTLPLDRELNCFPQNIFTTSDEDILRGQWYFSESLNMVLQYTQDELLSPRELKENGDKKIILTTDQDLIKDGVQAINDEFLEWFVKNPSCEFVRIAERFINKDYDSEYVIIIPKEEPKQELKIGDNTNFGIITDIKEYSVCFGKNKIGVDIWYKKSDVKLKPKDETLEEAAQNWVNRFYGEYDDIREYIASAFIKGAEWQAERMYNEEDLRKAFFHVQNEPTFDEWCEQFKKK